MFTHLHVHTEFSLLDGMCKLDDYIQKVKEQGNQAAVITDHGNINGAIYFIEKCEKENIKPIIGCEFYIVDNRHNKENKERMHLVALAKNQTGYKNLCRLVSISNLEGFYYKPRIDFEILEKYKEGLIILSACLAGPLCRAHLENRPFDVIKYFDFFTKNFGDDFYLEIIPLDMIEQKNVNSFLVNLAQKRNIKLVATNDVHYLKKEDYKIQEMLLCVSNKDKMANKKRWKFSINTLFLTTKKEMRILFNKYSSDISGIIIEKALYETENIVKKCENLNLRNLNLFPKIDFLKGNFKSTKDHFLYLIKSAMKEKGFYKKEKYIKRAKKEIEQIIQKGFIDYFLLVWDIIRFAKSKNILIGPGRGSSAGSLICYLLRITNVDPIIYKTLFFRFIDPNRDDLPDIDIDFEDGRRHEIYEYLITRYSQENLAHVGTFGKLKAKLVLKDLCRIYDVPLGEVEKIVSFVSENYLAEGKSILKNIFKTFEQCKIFAGKYPQIVEAAIILEGQIKQTGIGAAGIIITNKKISNYCPIEKRGADDEICIGYDWKNLEYLGLLKIDILGINFLTVIQKTIDKLKKKNIKIDIQNLSPNDEKVFESIREKSCTGIFQLEAPITQKISQEIGIDNFTEMVACTALTRPGPARSGSLENYIIKKHEKKEIKYLSPEIKKITEPTRGEILYQEQVMMIARKIGGFSWGGTNSIRKAIAKKEGSKIISEYQTRFIKGAVKRKIPELQAIKIWDDISLYGSYSFNKSHSVAYSFLSYWCAWLKHYYFKEYMTCFINYNTNQIRVLEGLKEFKNRNYSFIFCKAEKPTRGIVFQKNKKLIIGLNFIKGLGPEIIKELIKHRNCKNLDQWTERINKRVINIRIRKILINLRYFRDWGKISFLNNYFNCEKVDRDEFIGEYCPVYFCDNLLKPYDSFLREKIFKNLSWNLINKLTENSEENIFLLKGLIEKNSIKIIEKNNFQYCIADLNDGTGIIKLLFYSEIFKKYNNILSGNTGNLPVIIRGIINKYGNVIVKEFINIKLWKNGNEFDKNFARKLQQGMRNQEEIENYKKEIIKNIVNPFQVEIHIDKEYQAKNGLMAFCTSIFERDVEIQTVIWADAYQRWKTILNNGKMLSIRFSKFDQGKLYIDTRYSRVEVLKND